MTNRLIAVSIVTFIHQTFIQCQKDAAHSRPKSRLKALWQRRSLPSNLVQIERDMEIGHRTYLEVLLVDHRLSNDVRNDLHKAIVDKITEMAPIKHDRATIPADHLEVIFEMGEIGDETFYGFYVLKRLA